MLIGRLTRRLVLLLTEPLFASLTDWPLGLPPALPIQPPFDLLALKPGPLPSLMPASLPLRLPVAMLLLLPLRMPPRV
jgi:hypothetical protein